MIESEILGIDSELWMNQVVFVSPIKLEIVQSILLTVQIPFPSSLPQLTVCINHKTVT